MSLYVLAVAELRAVLLEPLAQFTYLPLDACMLTGSLSDAPDRIDATPQRTYRRSHGGWVLFLWSVNFLAVLRIDFWLVGHGYPFRAR